MVVASFMALQTVWKSKTVKAKRKAELVNDIMVNKLRYGLASAWLDEAERGNPISQSNLLV